MIRKIGTLMYEILADGVTWIRHIDEEYSTDEFSKHSLFCLFIHETDSYICKSCQVFSVLT